MKSFTDLEAWKKARQLRTQISMLVTIFPVDEKFRLCDQIIRSSRSIGNNIAEGHGRFHYADEVKFLINARGSAAETIDHLIIALDEEYISKDDFEKYKILCEECLRLINGYVSYLRNQAATKNIKTNL